LPDREKNGRIELVAAKTGDDIRGPRGALRRSGQLPVSFEEMQKAIGTGRWR